MYIFFYYIIISHNFFWHYFQKKQKIQSEGVKMNKFLKILPFLVFAFAVGYCMFYMLFTVPVIQKINSPGDVSYVGRENSHADVKYIDRRKVITGEQQAADVWWESKEGEWRRLEWDNGFTHSTGTSCVLREKVSPFSQTGITRGSYLAKEFQQKLEAIKTDYQKQSFFNRVWIWRVQEFH
jgi:hypothetical protein